MPIGINMPTFVGLGVFSLYNFLRLSAQILKTCIIYPFSYQ